MARNNHSLYGDGTVFKTRHTPSGSHPIPMLDNEEETMNAREAVREVEDFINEAESFVQTFDHEDHGDEAAGLYGDDCRFDNASAQAINVLLSIVKAAQAVVDAEPDDLFEGLLQELDAALEGNR